MKEEIETKNGCPKCKSTDLIFYPLAYFHDYKCNDCKHRFDDTDVIKINQ